MENENVLQTGSTKESDLHHYKTEDVKSIIISEVDSRGSLKSKMPSTVKMSVGHRFGHEAQSLMLDLKEGITPTTGLIGLKLIAIYADDEAEQLIDDMQNELDMVEGEKDGE